MLNKKNDSTNYDEFYEFLMSLEFLNINNVGSRIDQILIDQFESLMKIKQYFLVLQNHIEKITINDQDLWFEELKSNFKIMFSQFDNIIHSISEQNNPISLSVCFFRCIEYIKFFENFLNLRNTHIFFNNNKKNQITANIRFKRAVRKFIFWRKIFQKPIQ